MLAVEAAEVRRPGVVGRLADPRNAAEAAAFGRAADLVRLLRRGDHPEQIVAVRAGMIRESPAWLSAVEGAMWTDGPAMIRLLEREGAVLTDAKRRQLACLARDLGQSATADYLMQADRHAVRAPAPRWRRCAPAPARRRPVSRSVRRAGQAGGAAAASATPSDGRGLVRRGRGGVGGLGVQEPPDAPRRVLRVVPQQQMAGALHHLELRPRNQAASISPLATGTSGSSSPQMTSVSCGISWRKLRLDHPRIPSSCRV